jgi:hypothetical protein
MITATDLLDFLTKAQKLGIIDVTFRQTDEGYAIIMRHDWYDDNDWHDQGVFISNVGESSWDSVIKGTQFYDFDAMNRILDEKLEVEEQKKIKAQKRKELIARLTDEEKELLGVK